MTADFAFLSAGALLERLVLHGLKRFKVRPTFQAGVFVRWHGVWKKGPLWVTHSRFTRLFEGSKKGRIEAPSTGQSHEESKGHEGIKRREETGDGKSGDQETRLAGTQHRHQKP